MRKDSIYTILGIIVFLGIVVLIGNLIMLDSKSRTEDKITTTNIKKMNIEKISNEASKKEVINNTDVITTQITKSKTTKIESTESLTEEEYHTIKYWLYIPKVNTDVLIIYLHGGSSKGDDLSNLIKDGFPKYLYNKEISINSYVIMPELNSNYIGWSDIKTYLKDLIEYIKDKYNLKYINITGHSMGGKGTYDLALAYPELFNKVAPLSGSIKNTNDNINKLSNVNIWALVGDKDTIVNPSSSIEFIESLSNVNPNTKITIFESAGHFDVPELTYKNQEFLNWIQSK